MLLTSTPSMQVGLESRALQQVLLSSEGEPEKVSPRLGKADRDADQVAGTPCPSATQVSTAQSSSSSRTGVQGTEGKLAHPCPSFHILVHRLLVLCGLGKDTVKGNQPLYSRGSRGSLRDVLNVPGNWQGFATCECWWSSSVCPYVLPWQGCEAKMEASKDRTSQGLLDEIARLKAENLELVRRLAVSVCRLDG